jgi:hypothetical protein
MFGTQFERDEGNFAFDFLNSIDKYNLPSNENRQQLKKNIKHISQILYIYIHNIQKKIRI